MSSIFLSHSHKDKSFARKLAQMLIAHGMRVWLDEAEMFVGDSLISKIEGAIKDCNYLGVILSPNSITSEWVRREVSIALTEEIRGRRVKVLPLLIQPCEVPGFLSDKLYADFSANFDQGFERLLERLESDLDNNKYREKRATDFLVTGYQDWISFAKADHYLLDQVSLNLILSHLQKMDLSTELLEYLLTSLCACKNMNDIQIDEILSRLAGLDARRSSKLLETLFHHPTVDIRLGSIHLFTLLNTRSDVLTAVLIRSLLEERAVSVLRAGLWALASAGIDLTRAQAEQFMSSNRDWLVLSYCLRHTPDIKACLLISDGTDFSLQLGQMAGKAGYMVVPLPSFWEVEVAEATLIGPENELFSAYSLLILVRGEHFTGNDHSYSALRHYISNGGTLFATSWVSWETKHSNEFVDVLPFEHIRDTYNEDVIISCHSTELAMAKRLFPDELEIRTSFELLKERPDSVVFLKSKENVPIFGYRKYKNGTVYYLNMCQHSCFGSMPSPLELPELRRNIQNVFSWIGSDTKNDSFTE